MIEKYEFFDFLNKYIERSYIMQGNHELNKYPTFESEAYLASGG